MDVWTHLLSIVDRLIRAARRASARGNSDMDAAESRLRELVSLRKDILAMRVEQANQALPRKTRVRSSADTGSELQAIARALPIVSIDWTRRVGTAVVVIIDKKKGVTLPYRLATLLKILESRPVASDGFPEWLKHSDLHEILAKEDKLLQRHAVTQRLHRLGNAFEEAGLNRFWIERHPKRGVRLLIRRDAAAISTPVHSSRNQSKVTPH